MNESEERLQEQIKRLENGETLANCLADFPVEEGELLTLAAALRDVAYPLLDENTTVSQRAALLRLAQSQTQQSKSAGWVARLRDWWSVQTVTQRRVWATAVAAVLLTILVVGWANFAGTAELASSIEMAAVETEAEETIAQVAESDVTAVADTAVPVEESGEAVYIPLISFPLDRNPETAVIDDIQGFVEVQNEVGEWTAVSQTITLAAGQRLRTSAFSRASLTFHDGSQAHIGPDSELSLDVVEAQLPTDGFRTVIMTQWLGESEHHVQFRNDSGSRYEVKTPHGSGIARGTVFQVQVTADARAHYAVSEGRVDVTGADRTVSVTSGKISTIATEEPPTEPAFRVIGEGEVSQIGTEWIVGGQTFQTNEQTIVSGDPQIGDWVRVEGHLLPDGSRLADRITLLDRTPANRFAITGQVEIIGADAWTVAGQIVAVDAATTIDATISQGNIVRVDGLIQADGRLLAERIRLIVADAGLPFEFTGIVQSIDGMTWQISGVIITTDTATEIKGEITAGDVVKVEGYIDSAEVWLAHEIKLAEASQNKFEISGRVDGVDPWIVSGIPFEVRAWTEIEEGIVVGDLVKIEGHILADGAWVAAEIKRLNEEDQLTFEFYGTVGSQDPWVVSGITLPVTEDTAVDPDIMIGDLVKVTVTIRPDGSWQVVAIVLVNSVGEDRGCFSVTAVVRSISDDQITVDDWPVFQLSDGVNLNDQIQPGSIITLYACVDETGKLLVLDVIILYTPGAPDPVVTPPPADDDDDDGAKVAICHKPDKNGHTIVVSQSAVPAHLNHGDTLGACP